MDLGADDALHDRVQRLVQIALLHALEPLVAVLVGLAQRNIEIVVGFLSSEILKEKKGVFIIVNQIFK